MLGYVPLGIALGLMMENAGYNLIWVFSSSAIIYSGTAQFVQVSFLQLQTALYEIILIIVVMNARMMFYGLSFLERFKLAGKRRIYLIFALTDETYALMTSTKVPEGVKDADFMLIVSMMNHIYWVSGCVIGVLFGAFIGVDTTGIDFAMPALFIILAIDQWKAYKSHLPAIFGFISGVSMLALLGPDRFMVPALILATTLLIVFRKRIEKSISIKNKNADGEDADGEDTESKKAVGAKVADYLEAEGEEAAANLDADNLEATNLDAEGAEADESVAYDKKYENSHISRTEEKHENSHVSHAGENKHAREEK